MSSRTRSYSSLRQRSTEPSSRIMRSNPASRNCSPNPNRRIAKLNLYLSKSARNSSENVCNVSDPARPSLNASHVKRWDGNRRMTVQWDSVRRDPELWLSDGDCLVHFYERGFSRRGASLRVSLADLESSNCRPLLEQCFMHASPDSSPSSDTPSDKSEYFNDPSPAAKYELYIPAPAHLSREEALQYHLGTRNFFAWVYEKSVVGDRLGQALVALLERMNHYRSNQDGNQDDLLAYIDDQGYSDFRDCPDHALAVLQFAEKLEYRELWTDASVHCTGMNDRLDSSAEFEAVSRASQALITRAYIEMDLRLERAGRSLGTFLEEDLSGAYLGLGKEAELHLERFRSFLHSYYVGQHSYWPPVPVDRHSEALPKQVYRSMYFDFRNLYEYLVDQSSGVLMQDNKPVDGGICVFQNVASFDKRNKYVQLPHPLPLVPKVPLSLNQRGRDKWNIFGKKRAKLERRVAASVALTAATNSVDEQVMGNGLVREYLRFEKSWTMREETTVSCADARKVRWILIYSVLQTLISVTRVPNEVRDTDGVSYPLAVQIAGTPPWTTRKPENRRIGIEQQPSRPVSLRDQIIEVGPDMDILSAKPSPLIVNAKSSKAPSPPRRLSIGRRLSLRSPQPIRTPSIEFLNNGYGDVSPPDRATANINFEGEVSPIEDNMVPLQSNIIYPLKQAAAGSAEHLTDPSSPSTSEAGGSGGWSASSSEPDMDHASVNGSDSNYGDDENEEEPRSSAKPPSSPMSKRNSAASFGQLNPEVDQYIRS